jgi:hypothetical protein
LEFFLVVHSNLWKSFFNSLQSKLFAFAPFSDLDGLFAKRGMMQKYPDADATEEGNVGGQNDKTD